MALWCCFRSLPVQANHRASSAELPNTESWNRTSTSSLLAGLPNMGAAGKGGDSSVPTKHGPRSIQSKDSSVMQTSRGTTGLDSDGCNAQSSGHPSDGKGSRNGNPEEGAFVMSRTSRPAEGGLHPEIDSTLKLVMCYLDVPVAMVTVFKDSSVIVRESEGPTRTEPVSEWPMCAWADFACGTPPSSLLVPDVQQDKRLSAHAPLHLARGRLRFFGAVPLVSPNGECLGALCVCDVRERHMDTANLGVLSSFASMAMRHVVKEQQFRLAQQHHDELVPAMKAILHTHRQMHHSSGHDHCVLLVDAAEPGYKVLYLNGDWEKMTGTKDSCVIGSTMASLLQDPRGTLAADQRLEAPEQQGRQFDVRDVTLRDHPTSHVYKLAFRPTRRASSGDDDSNTSTLPTPSCPYIVTMTMQGHSSANSTATTSGGDVTAVIGASAPISIPPSPAAGLHPGDVPIISPEGGSPVPPVPLLRRLSKQVDSACNDIEGLALGPEISAGTIGRVFHGKWFGSPVVVKVVTIRSERQADQLTGALEALYSHEMRHPHIASVLRWAIARCRDHSLPLHKLTQQQLGDSGAGDGSMSPHNGGGMVRERASGPLPDFGSPLQRAASRGLDGVLLARASLPAGADAGANAFAAAVAAAGVSDGGPEAQAAGEKAPVWGVIDLRDAGEDMDAVLQGESSELAAPYRAMPRALPGKAASQRSPNSLDHESGGAWGLRKARPSSAVLSPPQVPSWNFARDRASSLNDWRRRSLAFDPTGSASRGDSASSRYAALQAARASCGVRTSLWSLPEAAVDAAPPALAGPPPLRLWVVTQHMDRGSLHNALQRGALHEPHADGSQRPKLAAVLATVLEVASALACLHAQGIVHGDLSAHNVLLSSEGPTAFVGGRGFTSKVAYAGLVRVLSSQLCSAGHGGGSDMAPHLAPELRAIQAAVRGVVGDGERKSAGAAAAALGTSGPAQDMYSFGYLMWLMYNERADIHVRAAVGTTGVEQLAFPAWAHPAYTQLAHACLAADPMRRPRADAVCARLQKMKEELAQGPR